MKTTKKTKTTPSVVVTPAAPASPGGYTIGLDLGDRSHYHCVLAATGQLIQPKTEVAPAWGSTRVPRVGFGVPPKPRLTIQAPGSLWEERDDSAIRGAMMVGRMCPAGRRPPHAGRVCSPGPWPPAKPCGGGSSSVFGFTKVPAPMTARRSRSCSPAIPPPRSPWKPVRPAPGSAVTSPVLGRGERTDFCGSTGFGWRSMYVFMVAVFLMSVGWGVRPTTGGSAPLLRGNPRLFRSADTFSTFIASHTG